MSTEQGNCELAPQGKHGEVTAGEALAMRMDGCVEERRAVTSP